MGHLAVLPQENLEQIFEYALPSGESYEFDGRLKASSASAIPPLGLLLVNRESYWLAHRILLKKNHLKLIANKTQFRDLIRVSNNYEVPKGNMETSIAWIANMAEFTPIINAILDVRGNIGVRFENFFGIVKLLRKHDLFIALNGVLPIHNTNGGPNARTSKAIAIDIQYPNELTRPQDISALADTHLRMIDLSHVARKLQWPLDLVKAQFNEDPVHSKRWVLKAKCTVAGSMKLDDLARTYVEGVPWAFEPKGLVYESMFDALLWYKLDNMTTCVAIF
jgi:hypothetical protein